MAKLRVGPSPFGSKTNAEQAKEFITKGFKRVNNSTLDRKNVEWSMTSGFRVAPNAGGHRWKAPKTEWEEGYALGRKIKVPKTVFQDFIGFQASKDPLSGRTQVLDPQAEMTQYIENAFGEQKHYYTVQGVGHITHMEYSAIYQVLLVDFATDGARVALFRVPSVVFEEFKNFAESGVTQTGFDGEPRHVLGIRFWDYVRIRGQRTGSRYKYEYVTAGNFAPKTDRRQGVVQPTAKQQREIAAKSVGERVPEQLFTTLSDRAVKNLSLSQRKDYDRLKTTEEKYNYLAKRGMYSQSALDELQGKQTKNSLFTKPKGLNRFEYDRLQHGLDKQLNYAAEEADDYSDLTPRSKR